MQVGLTFYKGRELIDSDLPAPGTPLWCRLEYKGINGWVDARFLRPISMMKRSFARIRKAERCFGQQLWRHLFRLQPV